MNISFMKYARNTPRKILKDKPTLFISPNNASPKNEKSKLIPKPKQYMATKIRNQIHVDDEFLK
jgi:hypothetical protein